MSAWKHEEREVARLLGGTRYPANSGGRVDVEGPALVAQVKHVQRLSLAQLESLALEMARVGRERGKVGVVVVKRRAGGGRGTPRLVVMIEDVWKILPLQARGSLERPRILAALHQAGGDRRGASALLGISPRSLYRKMHAYGITVPLPRPSPRLEESLEESLKERPLDSEFPLKRARKRLEREARKVHTPSTLQVQEGAQGMLQRSDTSESA